MTLPRQGGYRAPVSGGASGLGFGQDTLLRQAPGSLGAFRNGIALAETQDRVSALGYVMSPGESLTDAIRAVTGTKAGAQGRRIFVPEGTWDANPAGYAITAVSLEIIALAPGRTLFRRTSGPGAITAPMFTLSGSRLRVQGLTMDDTDNASYPTVYITGDFCEVVECHFDNVDVGVRITNADYTVVRDSLFENVTTTSVDVTGTSSGGVLANIRVV